MTFAVRGEGVGPALGEGPSRLLGPSREKLRSVDGVYFEAGFARGLNIPVIHTCKEPEFERAHFDTQQLPHLLWSNPAGLRDKLYYWIRGMFWGENRPPDDQ